MTLLFHSTEALLHPLHPFLHILPDVTSLLASPRISLPHPLISSLPLPLLATPPPLPALLPFLPFSLPLRTRNQILPLNCLLLSSQLNPSSLLLLPSALSSQDFLPLQVLLPSDRRVSLPPMSLYFPVSPPKAPLFLQGSLLRTLSRNFTPLITSPLLLSSVLLLTFLLPSAPPLWLHPPHHCTRLLLLPILLLQAVLRLPLTDYPLSLRILFLLPDYPAPIILHFTLRSSPLSSSPLQSAFTPYWARFVPRSPSLHSLPLPLTRHLLSLLLFTHDSLASLLLLPPYLPRLKFLIVAPLHP